MEEWTNIEFYELFDSYLRSSNCKCPKCSSIVTPEVLSGEEDDYWFQVACQGCGAVALGRYKDLLEWRRASDIPPWSFTCGTCPNSAIASTSFRPGDILEITAAIYDISKTITWWLLVKCKLISANTQYEQCKNWSRIRLTAILVFPISLIGIPLIIGFFATYQILKWMRTNSMVVLLWLATIAALMVPTIILVINPEAHLNGLTQFLLSLLLFIAAAGTSALTTIKGAKQAANKKWIPQARSSCRGLTTLWSDVKRLRQELSQMCQTVANQLPELQEESMRGARATLSTHCSNGASRLDAIANQLDDGVADWQSFISANCEGDECRVIEQELASRRAELLQQLEQAKMASCVGIPAIDLSPAASGTP